MSHPASDNPLPRMDRAAFLACSEGRKGHWERVDGIPVLMAAERLRHNRVKTRLWRAFDDAIRHAGLPCEAFMDGVRVEIGEDIDYEPDALVTCGDTEDGDATTVRNPIIIAEVTSRSTLRIDKTAKLADYFRLPSVMHYLIVSADRRLVLHHRRVGADIIPGIVTSGTIACDPPGLAFALDEIYDWMTPDPV